MKTVSGLKRSMFAASCISSASQAPSDASKGQNIWLLDPYGEFPKYSADFEALKEEEQGCCVFLQKYTRDLMLYFSKDIFVETIVSGMKAQLAELRSANSEITWTIFQKKILAGMPNSDDLVSTQSYLIMMRQENISLIEWTTNSIMIRALASDKGGTKISNVLAFKLWAGQVTNDEWVITKVTKPTTDHQRSIFNIGAFAKRLVKIDAKLFKSFRMGIVKQWTKQLLTTKDRAENAIRQRVKPTRDPRNISRDKYDCSACGFIHGPHEHSKKGLKIIKDRKVTKYQDKSSKYHNKSRKDQEVRKKDSTRRNEITGHAKSETKDRDKGSSVTGQHSKDVKKTNNKPRDYSIEARKKCGVCYDFKKITVREV